MEKLRRLFQGGGDGIVCKIIGVGRKTSRESVSRNIECPDGRRPVLILCVMVLKFRKLSLLENLVRPNRRYFSSVIAFTKYIPFVEFFTYFRGKMLTGSEDDKRHCRNAD